MPLDVDVPGKAHGDARTRLGVLKVDPLCQRADDGRAEPRAWIPLASASPAIPHGDRQGVVAHAASDLEVDAVGVAHRVRCRFGDRELDVGDDVTPDPRFVAPPANPLTRQRNAGGFAREACTELR